MNPYDAEHLQFYALYNTPSAYNVDLHTIDFKNNLKSLVPRVLVNLNWYTFIKLQYLKCCKLKSLITRIT